MFSQQSLSRMEILRETKYPKLLNVSTTVRTADFHAEWGRPVTKSKDMWDQGQKIGHKNYQSNNSLVLCASGWVNVKEGAVAALTLSSMSQKRESTRQEGGRIGSKTN